MNMDNNMGRDRDRDSDRDTDMDTEMNVDMATSMDTEKDMDLDRDMNMYIIFFISEIRLDFFDIRLLRYSNYFQSRYYVSADIRTRALYSDNIFSDI
jgi:hypothetical protein